MLPSMKTQKSRNEYADRLFLDLHEKDGYEWITKKAIREIVDKAYYNSTEFQTK